jgi:hypothetical protein
VRAHVVLAARFGIDDADVLHVLDEGQDLARAVSKISRSDSAYATALIAALRSVGAEALADSLEHIFDGERRFVT